MKKRVSFYLTVLTLIFSLQSCVSNYVVSQPITYKTDAKLAAIDSKKLEAAKKELISSFADARAEAHATVQNAVKSAAISKSIKFSQTIDQILNEAETYLGTPYRYGGMTRNGIDCSAFVLSVFGAAAGMDLPRVAAAQAQEGERVEKSELMKGDLVFFSHRGGRISHVGIVEEVTEDGVVKFIHAATSRGVMISTLNDSYWGPRYRFAKRILNEENFDSYAKMN